MEPLIGLATNYPSFTKLLTFHLTSAFPVCSGEREREKEGRTKGNRLNREESRERRGRESIKIKIAVNTQFIPHSLAVNTNHASCPPLRCIHLISHWTLANTDSLTNFPDGRDSSLLIRSQRISRSVSAPPLIGVAQWVILEPLIPDQWIAKKSERCIRGVEKDQVVAEYRNAMSQLHANLLTYLTSLSSSPVHIAMTSTSLSVLVGRLVEFQQKTATLVEERGWNRMDLSLERLSQFLQIGLSIGIISLNPGLWGFICAFFKCFFLQIFYQLYCQNCPKTGY